MADLNSDKIVLLDTLYETYSLPSSLAGVERLYKAARSIDQNIRLSDVRQYLRGKDSYTLHKTTKKKFPRRKMIAAKPSTIISCDLADLRKLSRYNNGINYLLVCIDIFSRYVKIVPLKKKNAPALLEGMKHILEGSEFSDVSRIHTDRGSEFYNRLVKDYLKNKNMILYSVSSYEIKAAIAERVIRTLKNKIYRYLTSENTLKYIDVLPQIVKSYNSSPHRGLGNNLSPVEVHNFRDPNLIKKQFHYMYKDGIPKKKDRSIALTVDDSVRLSDSLRASKFKRGYDTQNTIEIFRIRSVDKSQNPTVYYLKDLADEDIDGVFYRDELTPTQIPDTFPIRILGKKKINGRIKYRVTWVGYPEKFITYVDASDVEKLKK